MIVFAMIQSIPSSVLAETYSYDGTNLDPDTTVLHPGDVINYHYKSAAVITSSIYYCNDDATKSEIDSDSYTSPDDSDESFTVKDYMGTELSAEEFKEWKVDEIYGSSGSLAFIRLVAVGYTRSTINYVLDGGTNAEQNPDGYYEGKTEVVLADAEKEGCTFEGWYSDADFTTRVTSIPTTQTGSITLYAKFTANNYNIFYELDGGSNGEGNPDSYTYGIGVASFADAEKEGYTFEGWYADAEFTTQITSIDATQIRDVTLHAKFVEDEEETTTEEESTTEEETTTEEESTEEETTEEETTVEESTEEETTEEETTVEESTEEETTVEEESSDEETTEEEDTTENVSTDEETTLEENTTNNSGNEPDDTTLSDTTSNSEQPKTGDSSKWFLWAVLLLVSSCGMIGTAVYGKKKKMN